MPQVLRPFAWLAAISFLVGFVSYLALGRPAEAQAQVDAPYAAAVSSGQASWPASGEWKFAKQL